MRWGIILAPLMMCAVATPSPGYARDWPDAGGWVITEVENGCGVFQEFEGKGDTQLLVVVNLDGTAAAMMTNTGWSAIKDGKYELSWHLNGSTYKGTAIGTGESYASRKGFIGLFGVDFVDDFARGSSLRVFRDDVTVDNLSLNGTAAAVAMAKRCLAHLQSVRNAEERERKRFAHIADDPFADTATSKNKPEESNIIPRGNPGRWVTLDDYPAAALRDGKEGTVQFQLDVTSSGLVGKCTIISSSGHSDLDRETCTLIQRRARFNSSNLGGQYSSSIIWSIPK